MIKKNVDLKENQSKNSFSDRPQKTHKRYNNKIAYTLKNVQIEIILFKHSKCNQANFYSCI